MEEHTLIRPEDIKAERRPVFLVNETNPGSEVVGEAAAAMAAGYILFNRTGNYLGQHRLHLVTHVLGLLCVVKVTSMVKPDTFTICSGLFVFFFFFRSCVCKQIARRFAAIVQIWTRSSRKLLRQNARSERTLRVSNLLPRCVSCWAVGVLYSTL